MIRELQNDKRCIGALRDVLKIIETDMLVVNNATLDTLLEQDEGENVAPSDHLQVHHPSWHRRKSSGNVARDVGGIIDGLREHVVVITED